MPNLKRCNLEEPEAKAYEFSLNPKKQKAKGCDSVGNDEVEDLSSGSGSSPNDESFLPARKVPSNLEQLINQRALSRSSGKSWRSSRGRIQTPSRSKDAAVDVYSSRGTNFDERDSILSKELCEVGVEGVDREEIERLAFVKRRKDVIFFRHKNSKFQYYGEEEQEEDDVDFIGMGLKGNGEYRDGFSIEGMERPRKANCVKKKEIYQPQDFALGDIVWAKSGESYPTWPAVVVDPKLQAPKSVLKCCVPGAICVMFYGLSKTKQGTFREFGWVKPGMIFPFTQFLDRFRGQTQLYKSKPSDFQMAIEEALLAENGFLDTSFGSHGTTNSEMNPAQFQEATGFYKDQEYYSQNQEAYQKDARACDSCGLVTSSKYLKRTKGSSSETQLLCIHCGKLKKSKQYCGICKQIWHHSDGGNWVCCDGCNVWVHAECDKISSDVLKDLEHIDYYCPDCRAKPKHRLSALVKRQRKASSTLNVQNSLNPEEITVVCNGVEGTFPPKLHKVLCKCGSCRSKKRSKKWWTPSEWEKHTGCRAKNWKSSVKVKDTMLPLEEWLAKLSEHGLNPLVLNKWQLLYYLREKYEPVNTKWTTERCAICRWVEDWEDNKIIICNRCQIAVHQECYGAKDVQYLTSWVCRACETPDVIRECCLCPVRGGPLKPTDVDGLWVHVSCAWFRREVGFLNHEKMEPAVGILQIPPDTFLKRCVICNQSHGSCTQCCKCATFFHTMCASRAGYSMEVRSLEKNGIPMSRKLIYCAAHRAPNPDAVVVVHTPLGVFAPKSSFQNQKGCFRGGRVVPSEGTELPEPSATETNEFEKLS